MQKVLSVGDKMVVADENLEDVHETQEKLVESAQKNAVNVAAVLSKDEHMIVVKQKYRNIKKTKIENLCEDLSDVLALLDTICEKYEVDIYDVLELMKKVKNENEEN